MLLQKYNFFWTMGFLLRFVGSWGRRARPFCAQWWSVCRIGGVAVGRNSPAGKMFFPPPCSFFPAPFRHLFGAGRSGGARSGMAQALRPAA